MERLRQDNPEKYKKLHQLQKENPEEFHTVIRREMAAHYQHSQKQHGMKERKAAMELVRKYHAADSDSEKARLRSEIKVLLDESFTTQIEAQMRRLKHYEEQMAAMRQRLQKRQSEREKFVSAELEGLLTNTRSKAPGDRPDERKKKKRDQR